MYRTSLLLIALLVSLALSVAAEEAQPEPEESAVEPAPPEAMLRIVSTPPAAAIQIDGQDCGLTPATLAVSPGRHEIRVFSPFQSFDTVVEAVTDQLVEIEVELEGRGPARAAVGTTPWTAQARDTEVLRGPSTEVERQPARPSRDFRWPWAEFHFFAGPGWRSFSMPISPDVDIDGRSLAAMESGSYGLLGFTIGAFPFVRSRSTALRGLGVEGEAQFGVGIDIINERSGIQVDADYSSAEALLSYRGVFGRPQAGVTLLARFGWHRTNFSMGVVGNDLIPPMVYDALRIEVGVLIPLGIPWVLLEARVAYLPVVGTNGKLNDAYNSYGADPDSSNGVEFRTGLRLRISRFEAGIFYLGRWITTNHDGVGYGFGGTYCPDYSCGGWGGIESTGAAKDNYHQLRISVGVLL